MVIDIIFFVLAAYGFYVGYSRGIIKTVLYAVSILMGVIAAMKFSPHTTELLKDLFSSTSPMMFIAGFVVTFVGVILLIRLFARTLEGLLESIKLNFINQGIGGMFMTGFFALIFSQILLFADSSRLIDEDTKATSFSYPYLMEIPPTTNGLVHKLKPVFLDFWDYSMDYMDQLKQIQEQNEETRIRDVEEID